MAKRAGLTFTHLPAEIKVMIYRRLFKDCTFAIHPDTIKDITTRAAQHFSSGGNQPFIEDTKAAILWTSREIFDEACPVYLDCTKLSISGDWELRDPLAPFTMLFLERITHVQLDIETFVHINRKVLPSLKMVTLFEAVAHKDDVFGMFHMKECPTCGPDYDSIEQHLGPGNDWEWKRTQFLHLAEEEGWQIELRMLWNCCSSTALSLVCWRPPT